MRVQIYKAGRDHLVRGINGLTGLFARQVTDTRNTAIVDSHVGSRARSSRAVHNGTSGNYHLVCHRSKSPHLAVDLNLKKKSGGELSGIRHIIFSHL